MDGDDQSKHKDRAGWSVRTSTWMDQQPTVAASQQANLPTGAARQPENSEAFSVNGRPQAFQHATAATASSTQAMLLPGMMGMEEPSNAPSEFYLQAMPAWSQRISAEGQQHMRMRPSSAVNMRAGRASNSNSSRSGEASPRLHHKNSAPTVTTPQLQQQQQQQQQQPALSYVPGDPSLHELENLVLSQGPSRPSSNEGGQQHRLNHQVSLQHMSLSEALQRLEMDTQRQQEQRLSQLPPMHQGDPDVDAQHILALQQLQQQQAAAYMLESGGFPSSQTLQQQVKQQHSQQEMTPMLDHASTGVDPLLSQQWKPALPGQQVEGLNSLAMRIKLLQEQGDVTHELQHQQQQWQHAAMGMQQQQQHGAAGRQQQQQQQQEPFQQHRQQQEQRLISAFALGPGQEANLLDSDDEEQQLHQSAGSWEQQQLGLRPDAFMHFSSSHTRGPAGGSVAPGSLPAQLGPVGSRDGRPLQTHLLAQMQPGQAELAALLCQLQTEQSGDGSLTRLLSQPRAESGQLAAWLSQLQAEQQPGEVPLATLLSRLQSAADSQDMYSLEGQGSLGMDAAELASRLSGAAELASRLSDAAGLASTLSGNPMLASQMSLSAMHRNLDAALLPRRSFNASFPPRGLQQQQHPPLKSISNVSRQQVQQHQQQLQQQQQQQLWHNASMLHPVEESGPDLVVQLLALQQQQQQLRQQQQQQQHQLAGMPDLDWSGMAASIAGMKQAGVNQQDTEIQAIKAALQQQQQEEEGRNRLPRRLASRPELAMQQQSWQQGLPQALQLSHSQPTSDQVSQLMQNLTAGKLLPAGMPGPMQQQLPPQQQQQLPPGSWTRQHVAMAAAPPKPYMEPLEQQHAMFRPGMPLQHSSSQGMPPATLYPVGHSHMHEDSMLRSAHGAPSLGQMHGMPMFPPPPPGPHGLHPHQGSAGSFMMASNPMQSHFHSMYPMAGGPARPEQMWADLGRAGLDVANPFSGQLACDVCRVLCNSPVNLEQHLASRKHLARVARMAAAGIAPASRELQPTMARPSKSAAEASAGTNTVVHSLCRQMITSALNTVTSELLLHVKGCQDRAAAMVPAKSNAHRWYVCGLREVRKSVKLQRARSVVVAPNIEQMDAVGGLDDHLQDILDMCGEQGVPVVFALTRKRLGQIYGCRKRVSAVALFDFGGLEDLHAHVVELMVQGKAEWERLSREAGGMPPVVLLEEAEEEVSEGGHEAAARKQEEVEGTEEES